MNKLVSVIVPVYNVEEYIEKCVNSIQHQTYSNIEIIIVNDGSVDGSYEKCIQIAKQDKRIKLLSKENGGLASARNMGLEYAKGEYIAFVDSDDFIADTFIELMVFAIIDGDGDIACCNYDFYDGHGYKKHKIVVKTSSVWSSEKALDYLLYDNYYRCYAWNKLYKRKLFEQLHFPEGRLYEDILTTYRLYCNSKKVVVLPDVLYHYTVRNTSITHNTCGKCLYDILEPIKTIYSETSSQCLRNGCIRYYLFLVNSLILEGIEDRVLIDELKAIIKDNQAFLFEDINISKYVKLELKMIIMSYGLYRCFYKTSKHLTRLCKLIISRW